MIKKSFAISLEKTNFKAISHTSDFNKKVGMMRDLGFDGVEIAIRNPDIIDKEKIITTLQKYGMAVPAIGTGEAYRVEKLSLSSRDINNRKEAIKRIKAHNEFASRIGSKVVIGVIRNDYEKINEKRGEYFLDSLTHCLDDAADKKVKILLEPLNRYESEFIHTINDAKKIITKLNHPSLEILADTFHMNIEEGQMEKAVIEGGKLIGHVHCADSNRKFPGQGHIDFKNMIKSLKQMGYNGFISGEMAPFPDEETAMKGFLGYMKKYLP